MSLPLQPGLRPWPPWMLRSLLILCLALVVLVVGWLAPARVAPPELILGGPGYERAYVRAAERLISSAQRRCWMVMYVIRPDDNAIGELLRALEATAARGVDVRVLLDRGATWKNLPDDKHLAPAAWLTEHGVRVVLDEIDRTTHAKVLVVDSERILAGSHNWTNSAVTTNREASWLVSDAVAAQQIEAWLEAVPGWNR